MVIDYLLNVGTLCLHVELTKVIHKRSHAWWEVQDTINKMAKRNLSCINHAKPMVNLFIQYPALYNMLTKLLLCFRFSDKESKTSTLQLTNHIFTLPNTYYHQFNLYARI